MAAALISAIESLQGLHQRPAILILIFYRTVIATHNRNRNTQKPKHTETIYIQRTHTLHNQLSHLVNNGTVLLPFAANHYYLECPGKIKPGDVGVLLMLPLFFFSVVVFIFISATIGDCRICQPWQSLRQRAITI